MCAGDISESVASMHAGCTLCSTERRVSHDVLSLFYLLPAAQVRFVNLGWVIDGTQLQQEVWQLTMRELKLCVTGNMAWSHGTSLLCSRVFKTLDQTVSSE
eukprot:2600903-Amphidinium_carterae.1